MVAIAQGDIWWADLGEPSVQSQGIDAQLLSCKENHSIEVRIATTVVVPLTSNMESAAAPGNVALSSELTGLP